MSRLCPLLGTGGLPLAGPLKPGPGALAACCAITHAHSILHRPGNTGRLTWAQINLNKLLEATARDGSDFRHLALTGREGLSICPPGKTLPDRLMVRLRTLTPSIEVRILVGHPSQHQWCRNSVNAASAGS